MNSGEDTKPVPVYSPGTTRPEPRRRQQGSLTSVKRSVSGSRAPQASITREELDYLARAIAGDQRRAKNRAVRKQQVAERKQQVKERAGCAVFAIIVIIAVIVIAIGIWGHNPQNLRTSADSRPVRNVVQATMTPCERTMNEIDGATGRYGRMEIPNSTSLRIDGLCDVTFHYWTDKPTDSERYNERNDLLRSIGRVIQKEDLPVARLDLRTYEPNRSGSYVMWEHEIFQKSELPYI